MNSTTFVEIPANDHNMDESLHASSLLLSQAGGLSSSRDFQLGRETTTGRWTQEEHQLFLEGLKTYKKQWKQIADLIKTRTVVQIRTHAQKYFQKLMKSNKTDEYDEAFLQEFVTGQNSNAIAKTSSEDSDDNNSMPPEKKLKLSRPRPTDSANSTPKLKRAKSMNSSQIINNKPNSPKSVSESTSNQAFAFNNHSGHEDFDVGGDCDWFSDHGIQLIDHPNLVMATMNQLFYPTYSNPHPSHDILPQNYNPHTNPSHSYGMNVLPQVPHSHSYDSGMIYLNQLNQQSNQYTNPNHRFDEYDLAWLIDMDFNHKPHVPCQVTSSLMPLSSHPFSMLKSMNESYDGREGSIATCTTSESSEQDVDMLGKVVMMSRIEQPVVVYPTERVTGKPLAIATCAPSSSIGTSSPVPAIVIASSPTLSNPLPVAPVARKRGRPRRIPVNPDETAPSLVSTSMPSLSINTHHLDSSMEHHALMSHSSLTSSHVWDDEEMMGGLLEAFA